MVRQPDHSPGSKNGKHTGASQRVLGYLKQNANVEVTYQEIQKALGLPDYTVSNSVQHLIHKGIPIKKPMYGVALFSPHSNNRQTTQPPQEKEKEKPCGDLYEKVGVSRGKVIVRGQDDELYVLNPLYAE